MTHHWSNPGPQQTKKTKTNKLSHLYRREEENFEGHPGWYFNVWDTLSVYLELGVPKEKIVMGIPLYGRGFELNNTEETGLYCGAHAGIPEVGHKM